MSLAYPICFAIVFPLVHLIFPCRFFGRANIPEGPVIVCANHSSFIDPVLIAFAFGCRRRLYFMAKAELFRVPVLGALLRVLGAFPVVRGETDIGAIRTAIRHLKNGHQIMMFPEGTRVSEPELAAAKSGAIRIATKLGVPVLPIYISTRKKAFHCSKLVIGKPYKLETPEDKDYAPAVQALME
ncbi:MAG: lysophospholipid acyltransferase family protein, partial [Bacillota bacterium]